jgi:iron complex outermembrane receptor protein
MRHPRVRIVMVAAFALLAALADPGFAQEPTRIYTLPDTVMVIGERVSVDPLQVPMAATLVQASEWQDSRMVGLSEPLSFVPGVLAQSRAGSTDVRITSRGFGARGAGERSNSGTTRGIRITLDGFPLTEPDGRTSLDFADPALLARIRVIRSNTSTLFGPFSGGLIDLQTTRAFDRPYGQVRAEFGSFSYSRQVLDAGFVSGSARIQVAGSTGLFEGFREHSRGTQSTLFTSVVSEPSPTTTLGLYLAGTHTVQHYAGALTQGEFDADPKQADPAYVAQDARRDNHIGRIGAKLDHVLGAGYSMKLGVFAEPKSLHRSERNRYRDFQRVHTGGYALFNGPLSSDRLRFTAGLDEAWQDGSVLFYDLDNGNRGTTQVADQREGINDFGVFGEVQAELALRWTAAAGARLDYVHYISENHQDPTVDDQRTLDHVSPRVSLSFRPNPDHTLYAAVNGGIETPAFNEIDPPPPFDAQTSLNPFLDPSYSLTFEVGAKGEHRLGDRFDRVGYDLALYTLEVRNDIIPWDGGAYYRTAGKSRRSGIELGLTGGMDNGFSVRLAGTFSRNRYIDYETGAPDANDVLVAVRYDDNETAGIPSTAVRAAVRYEHQRGPFAELEGQRVGKYWANDANTDRVAAYTLLDATVGSTIHVAGRSARVFVSGRNLTDEKYAASVYINGVNGRYLEPGMERNVLAGITLGTE